MYWKKRYFFQTLLRDLLRPGEHPVLPGRRPIQLDVGWPRPAPAIPDPPDDPGVQPVGPVQEERQAGTGQHGGRQGQEAEEQEERECR